MIVLNSTNGTPLNPTGNVVAAAYSNNVAGTASTTLYDIDSNTALLLVQNPPTNGQTPRPEHSDPYLALRDAFENARRQLQSFAGAN